MEAQFSHKRHQTHHPSHSNYTPISQQHTKPSISGGTQFRILCPAAKVGGVIGKGGAVIQQLREDTGARIRIVDEISPFACYDERVILIVADSKTPNPNDDREEGSAAQFALLKVFERILKVDEERSEEERKHNNGNDNNSNNNNVVCRLLAPINQVGCVIGRGGKIVEKIRQESGAQVRILPREQIPACASPGEELIQMTGKFQAVKKALLSVSSCLQEHPRADMFQGANSASQIDSFPHRGELITDHHSRSFTTASASEKVVHNHRMIPEEDVVFRLLCPGDKFGILTGKGGSIVNAIQKKTGASIKIGDLVAPDADEWIVYISARESMDLKCSPAQDALIRVHSRLAEVRFEPGATVTARLLVHSQHIGCLLGKGGIIITEMRRLTGASIRILDRENGLNFKNQNDELVQIIGSLQSVQDALYQITSRLREILFPVKRHFSHVSSSPYFTNYQESSSPSFRPRHDQASPGRYQSPAGLPNAYDYRSAGQVHAHPSFSHDSDRIDVANGELDRYHYGGDRGSYGSSFERPPSPNIWHPQAVDYGNSGRFSDVGPGPGSGSTNILANNNESAQMQRMTSVEVVIPQILLPHVYGENKTNLGHITEFSGADVTIHDPKPGATEGHVIISGTPHQLYAAQSLVHAFILCGQAF